MTVIQSGWKSVTDKEQWLARRASFVAKAKATKVVWFPPKPVADGSKAASTATKASTRATKKTAGAAKKTAGAAKKATTRTRDVANPLRRKAR